MKILITGSSGSGKTYLTNYFKSIDLPAVDADTIEGLHGWYNGDGDAIALPKEAGQEFLDNHSFLWNRDFLMKYLESHPDIYLFGLSGNVFDMRDLFDKKYFLSVPYDVIGQRLQSEKRDNPMGKTEYQKKAVLDYAKIAEAKAKEYDFAFIDGTLPPDKIVELIK